MKITRFIKINFTAVQIFLLAALLPAHGAENRSTLDLSPVRITANSNGDLLVSDYTYGLILTVAPGNLDIKDEFNVNGRPLGIAWANDLIYVGNSTTGQVEVYNAAGEKQFILGQGNYPVATPLDIAVGNGNVYVVDGQEKVINIFTLDGRFIRTIPENGHVPELLANPTAIAVNESTQQIFISDYGDIGNQTTPIAPRIQVFNDDGSLSYSISAGTTNKYRFSMPQGLTVNADNQLFVIDALTGKIFVYNAETGARIRTMKKTGKTTGRFKMIMPLDLVIAPSTKDVFVTDNRMASIKVFKQAGGSR